jgi:hypothetical protein
MAFLAGDVMYHVSTTYNSPFVFDTSTFILITLCLWQHGVVGIAIRGVRRENKKTLRLGKRIKRLEKSLT